MTKTSKIFPEGLSIVPFSDGYDNRFVWGSVDLAGFFCSINTHGSEAVTNLIKAKAKVGHPFRCYLHHTCGLGWKCS